jgi:predicted RNA-binding Zn-ribbon protein involved in translation (DUF1610 family)
MAYTDFENVLEMIFQQARRQFGSAIKSRWVHTDDGCPGCGKEIDLVKYKKKKAVSVNAFIFREHGVLIAYFLCGKCGKYVIDVSQKNPTGTTELHTRIEETLKSTYLKRKGH